MSNLVTKYDEIERYNKVIESLYILECISLKMVIVDVIILHL